MVPKLCLSGLMDLVFSQAQQLVSDWSLCQEVIPEVVKRKVERNNRNFCPGAWAAAGFVCDAESSCGRVVHAKGPLKAS